MNIAICVGHNKKAQGVLGAAGLTEWEFNSILAKDIKDTNFTNHKIKIFKREPLKSYTKQMKILHKQLKEWNTDLAIELHFNAAIDINVNGHEILYCKGSKKGKKIAKIFDKNFNTFLENKDRQIKAITKKQRGGGFVCRGTYPCLILEPFFAKNQKDFIRGTEGYSRLLGSIIISLSQLKV